MINFTFLYTFITNFLLRLFLVTSAIFSLYAMMRSDKKDLRLFEAIVMNKPASYVTTLIQAGANPCVADQEGNTALHHACNYERINLVKTLIERGANINSLNQNGESPMLFAVHRANLALVKMLAPKVRITEDLVNQAPNYEIRNYLEQFVLDCEEELPMSD